MMWPFNWLFPSKYEPPYDYAPPPAQKAKFPWSVDRRDKTGLPRIVDANGLVVAQIMSGGWEAAARIVKSCNRAAALRGIDEC